MSEFKEEQFALSEEDLEQVSGGIDEDKPYICWNCSNTGTVDELWRNNGYCPRCHELIIGDC